MKEIKLKKLEESFESGIISREEYEKEKKKIGKMPESKKEKPREEIKEPKLKSDKILIIAAVILIALFAAVLGIRYFGQEQPQTIDDLHQLNFKGKLKPEQGYLYRDVYSFVKFEDLWYTQFKSPRGSRLYNIQFRYGPKEIEDIKLEGTLDFSLFNNATDYYVTFDPTGKDFSHVALAVSDFNQNMVNIFFKTPIPACDRNETFACRDRPIITCGNTDKIVLYVKETNESRVSFDSNCIIVEGNGFDLVKEIDRVLYVFYGMMEQPVSNTLTSPNTDSYKSSSTPPSSSKPSTDRVYCTVFRSSSGTVAPYDSSCRPCGDGRTRCTCKVSGSCKSGMDGAFQLCNGYCIPN